jgi:hypothetical protein
MTKLHPDTIREIARELADELERRRSSRLGIGALVQGDDQCDEKERSESMDHTIEATERSDGASSSPAQTAAKLLSRSRQRPKRNVLPMRPAGRAKAGR